MDPRYQSPVDQAIGRYVKLLNLKSNKSIRSQSAKHLVCELRQLLYAYLGVILPENLDEVVPMMSLSELAANKTHEREGVDLLLSKAKVLMESVSADDEDQQLDKVKSRVAKMLRIYHRQQAAHDKSQVMDNITNID